MRSAILLCTLLALNPGANPVDDQIAAVVMVVDPVTGQMGAGVWVAKRSVLTAAHVVGTVENGGRVLIRTSSGEEGLGVVVARDWCDLALVRSETLRGRPVAVEAGRPDWSDELIVVGHPLGLGWTIGMGRLQAVRRLAQAPASCPPRFQIGPVTVAPGSSGSGVFDRRGRLRAIGVQRVGETVMLAVPAVRACSQLIPCATAEATERVPQTPETGDRVRP